MIALMALVAITDSDHDHPIYPNLAKAPASPDRGSGVIAKAKNKCLTSNRAGAVALIVDFNRCEGEDACVFVCPYEVFEVRKIDKADFQI